MLGYFSLTQHKWRDRMKVKNEKRLCDFDISNQNEKIRISIRILMSLGFLTEVKVCINRKGYSTEEQYSLEHKENDSDYAIFEGEFIPKHRELYYFCFSLKVNEEQKYIQFDLETEKPVVAETLGKFAYWKFENFQGVPEWAMGKTYYEIFPDRFYRSRDTHNLVPMEGRVIHKNEDELPVIVPNEDGKILNNDYYGGDLRGIKQKLNYIHKVADIIYMCPIFYSPSTHRYDTINYTMVDPYLGEMEDLTDLISEAHKRGISVILDGVFNHVCNTSPIYQIACANPNSEFAEFIKKDKFGIKHWESHENMVELNTDSPKVIEYFCGKGGIIDQWFECGIDGLRLDLAMLLPDKMLKAIRIAVKRNKEDGIIIGEQWKPLYEEGLLDNINSGFALDTVMNYPIVSDILRYVMWKETKIVPEFKNINWNYSSVAVNTAMNGLTHDNSRILTVLGSPLTTSDLEYAFDLEKKYEEDRYFQQEHDRLSSEQYHLAKKRLNVAEFITFLFPGNPLIFAGDELGRYGLGNLLNRKYMNWNKPDKAVLKFYRSLQKMRRENRDVLKTAKLNFLRVDEIMIFERYNSSSKILAVANPNAYTVPVELPEEYVTAKIIYARGMKIPRTKDKKYPEVSIKEIPPYGVIALRKN